jgi:serine/threonine protein phosphatase PrpC
MNNNSSWKIIAASVTGTAHTAKNDACQDFFDWQTIEFQDEVLIAVVSDGAGSAKMGGAGAKINCTAMMREIRGLVEKDNGIKGVTREHALGWLKLLQTQFQVLAEFERLEINDFACTLLAAIVHNETAIFLQIGDGGIVYSALDAPGEYHLVIEPQQGEYANSTNFVTDRDATETLKFEMLEKPIGELAIFTDGLQRIALDYQTNTAHAPFFRPMFAPLRAAKVSSNLNEKLEDFLDSPKINERTDDDKTLILAARIE